MLLLNISTKQYIGSPLVRLNLTLVTWKGQCKGQLDLEGLYLVKEPT